MAQAFYEKRQQKQEPGNSQRQNTPLAQHVLGNQAMLEQIQSRGDIIQRKFEAGVSLIPIETDHIEFSQNDIKIDSMKLQGRSTTGLDGQGNHTIADTFIKKYQKDMLKQRPVGFALHFYSSLLHELCQDLESAGPGYAPDRHSKCSVYMENAQAAGAQMQNEHTFYEWRKLLTELITSYNDAYAYSPFSTIGVAGKNSGKGESSGKIRSKKAKRLGQFDLRGASYFLDINAVEQTGVRPGTYDTYAGVDANLSGEITQNMLNNQEINAEEVKKQDSYSKMLLWLILIHNDQIRAERAKKISDSFFSVFQNVIQNHLPQALTEGWAAAFQSKCNFTGLEFSDAIRAKAIERSSEIISEFKIPDDHPIVPILHNLCNNITKQNVILNDNDNMEIIGAGIQALGTIPPDKLDPLTRRVLTMYGAINIAYSERSKKLSQSRLRRIRVKGSELENLANNLPDNLTAELEILSADPTEEMVLFQSEYWKNLCNSFNQLSTLVMNEPEIPPDIMNHLDIISSDFNLGLTYMESVTSLDEQSQDPESWGIQQAGEALIAAVQSLLEVIQNIPSQ